MDRQFPLRVAGEIEYTGHSICTYGSKWPNLSENRQKSSHEGGNGRMGAFWCVAGGVSPRRWACRLRNAECGSRNANPDSRDSQTQIRGWEAHGTRGGTAKLARNSSAYGWLRLGRSLALPARRRSRADWWNGPCSGKQHILGHGRNTDGTRPDEEADRSAGRPRSPFSRGRRSGGRSRSHKQLDCNGLRNSYESS